METLDETADMDGKTSAYGRGYESRVYVIQSYTI